MTEACWPDLSHVHHRLIAVPVGSTEQHGPHLPLTTDTDIAAALVHELGRRREDVIVAPPVAYGASGEHQGHPGTISIGQDALELLLVELGRSATHTADRLLFVNGHGGNHATVARATRRLRAEGRDVLAHTPSFPGDAHAGRTETSLMLLVRPMAVRVDRAEAGTTLPLSVLLPRMRVDGVRAVSPNGVIGDPTRSSAAEGRWMFEGAIEHLEEHVERWSCDASGLVCGPSCGSTR